jgi:hypothetical protein
MLNKATIINLFKVNLSECLIFLVHQNILEKFMSFCVVFLFQLEEILVVLVRECKFLSASKSNLSDTMILQHRKSLQILQISR